MRRRAHLRHVHTGFIIKEKGVTIANPGSVTLPKEGTAHSYLILDGGVLSLKDIDGGKVVQEEKI